MRLVIVLLNAILLKVAAESKLHTGSERVDHMSNEGHQSEIIDRMQRAASYCYGQRNLDDGCSCSKPKECASGVCKYKECQPATCCDGVKNQDEVDIDCGGKKCPLCPNGRRCCDPSECASGVCLYGICQAPPPAGDVLTCDINVISQYWGNVRPYQDNADNFFGVKDTGLPLGCQVERAFVLHRHGARFPASNELASIKSVAAKLRNTTGNYTGPLSFFNRWSNQLGAEVLLPLGVALEVNSGVQFWIKYGRLLLNAAPGQNYYSSNSSTLPLLRANTISRVNDSVHAWANGFFALYNPESKYNLLLQTAAPGYNATLAAYYSCKNFITGATKLFDLAAALYAPVGNYYDSTVARLSQYVPSDVTLTPFDVFNMQYLCTYEYVQLGSSDFCCLFTVNEWRAFGYTVDLFFNNGFSFGSGAGRAMGVGYVQELLARLQQQFITQSSTSVNSTSDSNSATFPLDQKYYLDMSHDAIIMATVTALSIDYFRENLPSNNYPGDDNRHFKSSYMVPYAARLITEQIGCISPNPAPQSTPSTQYYSTEYDYSPANANYKFIRMRLNSGILPLSTIRGGYCAGRTDGLCPLSQFIASQANAAALANYGPVCFGNYTYNQNNATGDGNYFP